MGQCLKILPAALAFVFGAGPTVAVMDREMGSRVGENLGKAGGAPTRLNAVEARLWNGDVEGAIA